MIILGDVTVTDVTEVVYDYIGFMIELGDVTNPLWFLLQLLHAEIDI